jgi:hypothetical protein
MLRQQLLHPRRPHRARGRIPLWSTVEADGIAYAKAF